MLDLKKLKSPRMKREMGMEKLESMQVNKSGMFTLTSPSGLSKHLHPNTLPSVSEGQAQKETRSVKLDVNGGTGAATEFEPMNLPHVCRTP